MKSFEDYVFKALLADPTVLCDCEDVKFVRFEKDAIIGGSQYGWNSRMLFGRVVYRRKKDDQTSVTTSVAIKLSPEVHFEPNFCTMQCVNEIHFFTKIVPFLNSFVDRGNVDTYFPNCFFSCTRNLPMLDQSAIIFENLTASGYVKGRRSGAVFLDYKHLSLMIKRLGQFHAYSFRAAKADLHSFRQMCDFIPRIHERFLLKYWQAYQPFLDHYVRIFASNAGLEYSSRLGRIQEITQNFVEFLSLVNSDSSMEVICHGDYMNANVFFRYEKGAPVDLKVFDLGMWRLASPVLDVAYVMYLCADQRTRDEHWHHLMADYRSGLAEILPVDDVPSEEQLLREFQKHCWFEVMSATYLIPDMYTLDAKTSRLFDVLVERYPNRSMVDLSTEDIRKILAEFEFGGVEATRAILDVIKDMLDRGFL